MPRAEGETRLVPSLLDRLLDDSPEASSEPASARMQDVRDLKAAVGRDLQALLNTRREALDELPSDYAEVTRSLVNYGLPDFSALSVVSMDDRGRMARVLEEAIVLFEPRLERVQVTLEPPRTHDQALRFRVEALLRVRPSPEPVTFDAVLQLSTQQYDVRGSD